MCKRVHACVSHFTFIYLLLANLSKSESKRVSPKIIVGKFPILQIRHIIHSYSAFSMCLYRRLDSYFWPATEHSSGFLV